MNPLLQTLTCPQIERCIETVLGRPVPRQASKAAALARLGREMRDRGLDAAEVLSAAGLPAPAMTDQTEVIAAEVSPAIAPESVAAASVAEAPVAAPVPQREPYQPKSGTLVGLILNLLLRPEGATRAELLRATGAKTVSGKARAAALSAGRELIKARTDEGVRYTLAA